MLISVLHDLRGILIDILSFLFLLNSLFFDVLSLLLLVFAKLAFLATLPLCK
jgi:hypothetical protein